MDLPTLATNARNAPNYGAFLHYANCALQQTMELHRKKEATQRYDTASQLIDIIDDCVRHNAHELAKRFSAEYRRLTHDTYGNGGKTWRIVGPRIIVERYSLAA